MARHRAHDPLPYPAGRATLEDVDPQEYRDARWYALLREADDLGVPEDEAPTLVQRVLDSRRRAIRRADDPDPLVREALRDAVLGPPPPPRRPWRAAAALLTALVAVGAVVLLTRPEQPLPDRLRDDQVPSLFGYDETAARDLLSARGLRVTVTPFWSCEVLGRVVGSDPPTGTPIQRGDAITVYSSVPADVACLTDYQDRVTAWQLLDFANGRGRAPAFADRVFVYASDREPVVLDRATADDRTGWAGTGVLQALQDASAQVSLVSARPLQYRTPAIRITAPDEGAGRCGVPDPAVAGSGDAFALLVQAPDGTECPTRVDVYRTDDRIEALAFYPASP